jgi:hypothetical protein
VVFNVVKWYRDISTQDYAIWERDFAIMEKIMPCTIIHYNQDTQMTKKHFTTEEADRIGKSLGITWSEFDVEQFRMGLDVELEHGLEDPVTNVTNSDPMITGKIALAHLNEFPDYYTRLEKMEREAEVFWGKED